MAEDTPEPMNLARFAELVAAYGSRIERWPEASREDGRACAVSEEGHAILREAAELDTLLESYVIAPPGAALQGRIIEGLGENGLLRRRLLRWWEGLGLFGVGLAGVAAGVVAMSLVMSGPAPETGAFYDQAPTVFGDVGRLSDLTQEAQ